MQKYFIKLLALVLMGMLCLMVESLPVHAQEHYDVYHYDKWNEAVPSQAGYIAERAVSGRNLKTIDFSEPSDMCIDSHERIFIADTGNHRIVTADVHLTEITRILKEFTYPDGRKTTLNHPKGIYVAPETELLYIADSDNARILVCDENGMIQKEITKPDSVLFPQELTFFPEKVIADKAGNIYVILGNITSGTVMFNAEGEFLGYYGANAVEATSAVVLEYFWKKFSTEEMRSRTVRTVPTAVTNFDFDTDGFLYTCSQS
ncbi:MAG: hypothetical protein IKI37_07670, partial [Oscillospiraceae bacterium]|nr:hypothetical protein [Oscillospiraceae bacterium]